MTGANFIYGGANADSLSGGAGNDDFRYGNPKDSVQDKQDVISDFSANTWGWGTNGAAHCEGRKPR